jgi:hypothetical protein
LRTADGGRCTILVQTAPRWCMGPNGLRGRRDVLLDGAGTVRHDLRPPHRALDRHDRPLSGDFGVAAVGAGANERLFVYGEASGLKGPVLGRCDTSSYAPSLVGVVAPLPPTAAFPVNLTADEAGHLFAYAPRARCSCGPTRASSATTSARRRC